MTARTHSPLVQIVPFLLAACLFNVPAQAWYSAGSGTADDPYQIATAADLIALGETPADYDKHFVLTADIDLDPGLPGRKVFDNAVIAGTWKLPFTGVFDGKGHTISHLTIVGEFSLGLFGQLGWDYQRQSYAEPTCTVTNLAVEDVNIVGSVISAGALAAYVEWAVVSHSRSTGRVSGKDTVGGLVGHNQHAVIDCHSGCTVTGDSDVGGLVGNNNGSVTNCRSTGTVNGGSAVGGLVGRHRGSITQSYSTGAASGKDAVGGLVGRNGICSMLHRILQPGDIDRSYSTAAVKGETCVGGLIGEDSYGSIRQCYSTGAVSGSAQVGGLVSEPAPAMDVTAIVDVTASFWDVETSGLTVSSGGQGKTTAQMQTAQTFLDAGWDFVGETKNGTEDIWWIDEGKDYPRLRWEAIKKCEGEPQMNTDERESERGKMDELTQTVIRCAFTVSNTLGCGFLEKVYENALAHELRKAGLKTDQQSGITIHYDGVVVGEYAADLLIEGTLLVELKAVKELDDVHLAQCLNYLRATNLRLCLLMNCAKPKVEIRRIANKR